MLRALLRWSRHHSKAARGHPSGEVGIFSQRTNQTQEAWVYSHDGPIGHRNHGYILMTDQSDNQGRGVRIPDQGSDQGFGHGRDILGGPTGSGAGTGRQTFALHFAHACVTFCSRLRYILLTGGGRAAGSRRAEGMALKSANSRSTRPFPASVSECSAVDSGA
eukprot:2716719-Pyramimonas_sp.AAC.1